METAYSENDLPRIADDLLKDFSDVDVWIFHGEMGTGKTALIKHICSTLGVQDEMSSPTFSIVNEYRTANDDEVYHFDFYRMERAEEAINIGIEDYFFSGNKCFAEWPEIIKEFLPDKYLEINIKLVGDNNRHLITRLNGPTI